MCRFNRIVLAAGVLLAAVPAITFAQQIKMEAFLRVEEQVDAATLKTIQRKLYVEVFADKRRAQGVAPVATLLLDDEPISQAVTLIPTDNSRFRMDLPANSDPTKTYRVYIADYVDEGGNRYGKLVTAKADAQRIVYSDGSCGLGLSLNFERENDDTPESERYKSARLTRLYKWAQRVRTQPAEIGGIKLEIEALTQPGHKELAPRSFALLPESLTGAVGSKQFDICFVLNGALPTEKFDARLNFNIPDAPLEVATPVPQPGMPGLAAQPAPKGGTDDKPVGVRPIERNLDLGVAFTSGLEKVKVGNATVLERMNRGTLDLRLAPFKDLITLSPDFPSKRPEQGQNPEPTRARVNLITPFYVDAKVSTGKIDDNSLAVNRIVFGFQNEMRFYRSIGVNNDTYYALTFRGANASDRDLKQLEAKGVIEFRPMWGFFNHRLIDNQHKEKRFLFPGEKPSRKTIRGNSGYEIRPFVGFEIGKTYHRDRPALAVKPSDTVRRPYVGLDVVLNPIRRLTLAVSDTFYFRLESNIDRRKNYFKGSIEFPLNDVVDYEHPAQTVFVQYENGGQPPFATPNVNTLKVGYRLQWDRWFWSLR